MVSATSRPPVPMPMSLPINRCSQRQQHHPMVSVALHIVFKWWSLTHHSQPRCSSSCCRRKIWCFCTFCFFFSPRACFDRISTQFPSWMHFAYHQLIVLHHDTLIHSNCALWFLPRVHVFFSIYSSSLAECTVCHLRSTYHSLIFRSLCGFCNV
jgi:hypothetical protein